MYELLWIVWIAASLGVFGVIEWAAIRDKTDKPSGTLSATLRRWIGTRPKHWRRWILGLLFTGGLALFGLHILIPVFW